MPNVVNISEAASLALHAMAYLASDADRPATCREIAEALEVSGAHLSKVLQRLAHAGLITSTPGPKGGFRLARPSRAIRLLEIYEVISGPLRPTTCLLGKPVCDGKCILGDLLRETNRSVARYLSKTRLSELSGIGRRT